MDVELIVTPEIAVLNRRYIPDVICPIVTINKVSKTHSVTFSSWIFHLLHSDRSS